MPCLKALFAQFNAFSHACHDMAAVYMKTGRIGHFQQAVYAYYVLIVL
jgi:hypothetical protein